MQSWCVAIIDESPDNRADIRSMLLNGCDKRLTFLEAGTAEAGIQMVLGATSLPDCIVLDYDLPEMEAPELLAALAGPDGMPVCPVVVVTGSASPQEGRRVLRAGAQDYIGKDWTTGPALVRALENACESWAMARELHQRKTALQLLNDRETFRSLFLDSTRELGEEQALKRVAARLLGQYLKANRVLYGEADETGTVVVGPSYVSGVQQMAGIYNLHDYGPTLLRRLMSGESIVVSDVQTDSTRSDREKSAYAKLEIVAYLIAPILKNGQLVGVLAIHQTSPRDWSADDISIVREIAQRTWAAVEHARAESSLLAKELQLSQMMEIMPSFSAVLTGPDFVVQLANQSFFDLVGRGSEIIGKPVLEALDEIADQPFPALLEQVYRTGTAFEAKAMIARLARGPGKSLIDIFVDFSFLPLYESDGRISGIFVHGLDRTAEVSANLAVAQGTRELRSVTENTPDLLARYDREFRHVFVNSIVEKITGCPVSGIIGKTNRELDMPRDVCDELEKAIRHVFDHQQHRSLDFSLPTLQGPRHFSCRLVPEFNELRQVASVLSVTHDITERRAYEQQLLEQDLRKNEFLATLAHELRNPLAPIRTGLQLLKRSPQTDAAAHTLPVMERQVGHLVRLIDDLLDISRISSGKIVLKCERVAFQEVAVAAVEASQPFIDAAGHALEIVWPDQPLWLDADPTRLMQIFSNLLTNAAKYSYPGGRITFAAQRDGEHVLISVQDTGMGIPADMLGTVFDVFTQVNRTLDRSQGGLGIGLSLVRTLVQMHGGSVQAASGGIDLGSEFTVILPLASAPAEPQSSVAPVLTTIIASRRILVVDDNVDAAETMVMLLELYGYDTCAAFSGEDCLEKVLWFHPDIVFLDIGLPGMNGHEVAQKLLAHPVTAATKLIALTGWGTEEDVRKSTRAGFHAHLTKPVDPEVVEALLATLLPA
ncbi:hypothetical protein GCM10022212_08300 [Actimicrobium antarcticum]|uniref:histidine kinase n=1 Tax=Actimicrobium antarcticum TaxID=1051899 RepID=A0ABP7SSR3_9BURK